jgi:hypothetical protein
MGRNLLKQFTTQAGGDVAARCYWQRVLTLFSGSW